LAFEKQALKTERRTSTEETYRSSWAGSNMIGGVLEAPVPEKSGLVKKMSPFSKPEKPL